MRGASVAAAQRATGPVPWTARARVVTLARGPPQEPPVRDLVALDRPAPNGEFGVYGAQCLGYRVFGGRG